MRATTDRRSSPLSSATIDDPSLTTATGTSGSLGRIELEHHAAELDVVAGFEPLVLERGDHAHPAQPVLDVGERLLVRRGRGARSGGRRPRPSPGTRRRRSSRPRRRGPPPAGRPGTRRPRPRAASPTGSASGTRRSSSTPQLVEPVAGRRRGDDHRHPEAGSSHSPAAASASSSGTRSAFESARMRGSSASRGSCSASSCSITPWLSSGSEPSSGSRSSTCTSSRVRSTWARKSCPSPAPSLGALDQARDVGDHELAVVAVERAEDGLQRRERIRGDLRLRAREPREQRRLAGVGQADEADVGQQLEMELDAALLARQPALGDPRGLAGGGLEARVAAPAGAAAGDRDLLAGPHEVVAACRPRARPACPAAPRRSGRRRRPRGAASPARGRRARRGSAPAGGRPAGRAASRRSAG